MIVEATIIDGPIPPLAALDTPLRDEVGAALVFDGIVRHTEDGRPLVALDYEAYDGMAKRELLAVAVSVAAAHGVLSFRVWHSRGRVPVGAASLRVVIHSRHRKESLAAMDEFIDRLKRDVPIWKHAVFAADGPT
ncbi:MAG: molybdenum cofactor biosynthesis protein MoaE [Phycisphaerae bacterium]